MGSAHIRMRHNARHRILAGYGGALAFGAAAAIVWWVFSQALTGAGWSDAPLLAVWLLVAHRMGAIAVRTARHAFLQPSVYVENDRLVIEDPTTLSGPQSIPFHLIQSIHVGPDVAGWLVGTYATFARSNETQLGRFPQLPNAVIVLHQPVYVNQARPRMLRLWHLSAPPSPDRPTNRIWLTVEDHDTAFLRLADRGFEPAWATADNPLPVWE
ncbi:MAG: hypothetical protein OER12_02200 [Acidimicrobiia bacterium]|nr:hypothetical protein [Acidimicrobiia bacterium]